jgi:8-oxo-dGTP diphosphatase
MKPTKNSVAVVIRNEKGEFLVVKRPDDEPGALAGVWGFPAITLKDGESEQEGVLRTGQVKLGAQLRVIEKLGDKTADRGEYTLHLSDFTAELVEDDLPSVPQADTSMTQYTDLKYTNDSQVLFPAAQKGSLCSQIYLQSLGLTWSS